MTEPQPPDFVIRPAGNASGVHQGMQTQSRNQGLDPSQMAQFNQWGQNIAYKDDLAAGTTPVVGTMATGTVNGRTVGVGPPTSVAVSTENMLVSQDFTASDTVVSFGHWSWDGTDGNLTLGCARVDCDGTQSDLVSNEIPVLVGENIEVSCQTKWENITYTSNNPIVLGVEKYRKGRDPDTGGVVYLDLGGVDVDSLVAPPANGAWGDGDLAGIYVVEAGVDMLRFRFRATPNLIGGVVKWDEAVFLKLDLIDDAAVPGVGTTVDDIVTNLFGSEGEGFTHNDAAVALGNTSAAITSINARLSATEAEASPGAVAADDFLWSGEITTSTDWGGTYTLTTSSGNYAADGSDAVWVPSVNTWGDATQTALFDFQGTGSVSTTDYQQVQLVLSSGPATGPNNFKSYVYLLGRISSGFGSYVRACIGSDGTYFVDHWNGSVFTVMNSGTCSVPGQGTLLTLYCGKVATTLPRHFKLTANTSIICEFDEVGTASPLGASNRKWGWGGKAEGGYYLGAFLVGSWGYAVPPKINQWLGYEQ